MIANRAITNRRRHSLPPTEDQPEPSTAPGAGTLRDVVDMVIRSVDAAHAESGSDAWKATQRAYRERKVIVGEVVLTLEAGVFLYIGDNLYGFAPRRELPFWVPNRPRRDWVGRDLEGVILSLDPEAGCVNLSPRLHALRRARAAIGASQRVSGRVETINPDGATIDIGGAKGWAPRSELDIDWLLDTAEPGIRWRGYVIEISDPGAIRLSRFGPNQRTERAARRHAALTELETADETTGRVLAAGDDGALVSLADGLVTGFLPATEFTPDVDMDPGTPVTCQVVGPFADDEHDIDILLRQPRPTD